MQSDGGAAAAGDEGSFSPLRVARAGRRAGQHAAIQEPGSSTGGVPDVSSTPQAGPLQQARQLQHQGSSAQQRAQQDGASASAPSSSAAEQQQPQQPEQDSSQPAAAAPPVKRVGFSLDLGAEEAAKQQNFSGVSRRKQEQLQKEQQAEAKQRNKYDDKLVDAQVDVPELEEEGKEDITRIVAQAPKSSTPQVQPISELELDQAWVPNQAACSTDMNLSLLTSCLLPSAQVVEPPEVWDYSLLFSQLKAELQNEVATPADSSTSGANLQDDPIPA